VHIPPLETPRSPERDQPTSWYNIETTAIRGFLTRQVFLSKVVYCFSFKQDRESSSHLNIPSKPTEEDDQRDVKKSQAPVSTRNPTTKVPFSTKEDELLIKLKQEKNRP
jgi:hypothetical protein